MFKVWPGCFYYLFCVRNVSYGGYLLVSSMRFLLHGTLVLSALPHLQKVLNPGQSVQFDFLCLIIHFRVIFCVRWIQFWISARQNPIVGCRKLPYTDFFAHGLGCGFWLPPADIISVKGTTGLNSGSMWYDREHVVRHIWEISVLQVRCLWLTPPIGYVWYPQCTGNLRWFGVEIIVSGITLHSVRWCSRQRIEIEAGGGIQVCCEIASSRCLPSHIVIH